MMNAGERFIAFRTETMNEPLLLICFVVKVSCSHNESIASCRQLINLTSLINQEGLNGGGGGGGGRAGGGDPHTCRLSDKISFLSRLSVKSFNLCRLSVNLS